MPNGDPQKSNKEMAITMIVVRGRRRRRRILRIVFILEMWLKLTL